MLRVAQKAFWPARIPVRGHARRHRAQLPRGPRVSGPPGGRARGQPRRRLGPGGHRLAREQVSEPRTELATASRPRCCSARWRRASTPRSSAARRDEDKARARSGSSPSATTSASGTPRTSARAVGPVQQQDPRWRVHPGLPLSNWTELDIWHYIEQEQIELPSIYFAHDREVVDRKGMLYAVNEFIVPRRRARPPSWSGSATARSGTPA